MDGKGKLVVGLLAGLAAGAALGVLFAPEKGSETRQRLASSLKDAGQKLKNGTEEFLAEQGRRFRPEAGSQQEKMNPVMS